MYCMSLWIRSTSGEEEEGKKNDDNSNKLDLFTHTGINHMAAYSPYTVLYCSVRYSFVPPPYHQLTSYSIV